MNQYHYSFTKIPDLDHISASKITEAPVREKAERLQARRWQKLRDLGY